MSGFDKFLNGLGLSKEGKNKLNEIGKKASEVNTNLDAGLKKEQQRERTLSEKYAGYDGASDSKKKRIEARDKRRKERYQASKERVDAKRERYAEKQFLKGNAESKEQARMRFNSLRDITNNSDKKVQALSNLENNILPTNDAAAENQSSIYGPNGGVTDASAGMVGPTEVNERSTIGDEAMKSLNG